LSCEGKFIYGKIICSRGVHSSAWIEWLPAEQLVEGSSPSGPVTIMVLLYGFFYITDRIE
jgi:hypothetical protein